MTAQEIIKEKIKELKEIKFDYFGVRFEKKLREVGDFCGNSKSNIDRIDARDFPEYGTDEYNMLNDLNGTSAYDVDFWEEYIDLDDIDEEYHVYLIAGNSYEEGEDYDEMIIKSAEVIAVIK